MGQKILIVDDDSLTPRLFQRHLEKTGYQMLASANGREAVEVAERELPHLIVMDIMMSEMDGLTALKQLKKIEATKNIPVIVISANAHPMARQEAETAGAAVFLTKPFSPSQLLAEIQRLIPEA